MVKLDLEGHAPIRHGGPNQVTDLQLEDRAVRGIDPASGTTFDAFNKFPDGSPKPHKVGRNATAFTSDDALLQADDFARSSTQFQHNIATARANGDLFVDPVEIPLRDVFGNNYQDHVRGVTRLGSKIIRQDISRLISLTAQLKQFISLINMETSSCILYTRTQNLKR